MIARRFLPWDASQHSARVSVFAAVLLTAFCVAPALAAATHGRSSHPATGGNYVVYVYPEENASGEPEIRKMLGEWSIAAAQNNVDAESQYYAPEVGRYFLRRNVSNAFVRRDKEALRRRGYALQSFAVRDIEVQFASDSEASVSLVKSWVMAQTSGARRIGSTRSRLWLRRTSSGWKITGEQDLKPAQSASARAAIEDADRDDA